MKKDKDNEVGTCLVVLGIGAAIGALTGLGLSSTALSPLIVGGIVAAVPITLLGVCIMLDSIEKGTFSKEKFLSCTSLCAASAAAGVGLAAGAMAIFPGATLGMGSLALAGAVIAPIAAIAGILATSVIIEPIAKKVNKCIISPIVEYFSSKKEEGCNLPAKTIN